jgi:hypothetical protein
LRFCAHDACIESANHGTFAETTADLAMAAKRSGQGRPDRLAQSAHLQLEVRVAAIEKHLGIDGKIAA